MGAYMYPIKIKREPQKVRYVKEVEMDEDIFTVNQIKKLVKEDECFSILTTDEGLYSKTILSISGERMETDEEVKIRVEGEEKYMDNYNKFHSKNRS